MDPDASYVCTLDAKTQKKAEEELNEVPSDRLDAVKALRAWIESQPHLRSRTDTQTLLIFLRSSKFSQLRAREMIEGNLTVLTNYPEWFRNLDTRGKDVLKVLEKGYCLPLPKRTADGCQIMLYRIGVLEPDPKKYSFGDTIRAGMVAGSYNMRDESAVVNGTVFLFDFTGVTMKHMTGTSLEDLKKWNKVWQKNFPGRFKAFHYYNAGAVFDMMMAATKPFLSKKFQDRIKTHNTLETLYKYIPKELLPADYLPDEYDGPCIGTMDQVINNFINDITKAEFREDLLHYSSEKFGVDMDKKPKDNKNDIQASFRKLNVD